MMTKRQLCEKSPRLRAATRRVEYFAECSANSLYEEKEKVGQRRQTRQDETINVVGCFNNYEGDQGFVVEVPQSVSRRYPVFLVVVGAAARKSIFFDPC